METKELTIKIKPEERAKAKRKAWELKVYARMSVLALAAMATARLVLLTIDNIQLRAGTGGGEICIPAYAAIFIYTGWKLKSWTAGTRKGKRECTTTNATAAGAAWTRGNHAKLAAYLMKESRSTMEKYQEIGKRGKRYSKTQNMDKPVITYKVVPASSWRKEPKARKGAVLYKFDDGATCKSGWHEMTGYPYQEYFEVFNE